MRLSFIRLAAIVAAASLLASAASLLGSVTGAGPAAAATSTAITLRPSVGPPTTKVQVGGSGYGAGETVAIFFGGSRIASTLTDPAGAFSKRIVVPALARPGYHTVEADGLTSSRSARAVFLVRTDWVQGCFETGRSCFNPYENVIGPRTAGLLARAWTAPIGASGAGSPVYQGGVLYAGGADGVHGLDPATGAIIINFRVGPVTTTPAVFPGSGRSPAEIVFGTTGGTRAAARRAGKLLWQVA